MAIIGVFMAAGFSFQGTELLGVAAGETSDQNVISQKQFVQSFGVFFYSISLQFSLSVY